jgi:phosphonoacetate hydrolase
MAVIGNNQRVVVAMIDGFGTDYFEATPMPALRDMAASGLFKSVSAMFPSITNVNNASICCGAWPAEHGITGNSYYDRASGTAAYMNAADFIRVDTAFQRAAARGIKSALLTSKRKTVELLGRDTELAIAAEKPPPNYIERYGAPDNIYSAEINYWLWTVGVDLLRTRPDIGLLYVHTTDYPMHRWAPEEAPSLEHLTRLDALIGEARAAAPDAAFFVTADHGMNAKTQCWDLACPCAERGTPIRFSLSPERDYYIKHHRNFTGCAYVWLKRTGDYDAVAETVMSLDGIEEVIPAAQAATRFHLLEEHIGDMVVTADKHTMIGDLDGPAHEALEDYRAHGSLYEMDVPLIIYNPDGGHTAAAEDYEANKDLIRQLYR